MLDRGQRHVCTLPQQNFGRTDSWKESEIGIWMHQKPKGPDADASDGVETTEETLFTFTTCSQMFAYQKFLLETCVACRERILVQLYSVWHSC